jgi:hypothetical protein
MPASGRWPPSGSDHFQPATKISHSRRFRGLTMPRRSFRSRLGRLSSARSPPDRAAQLPGVLDLFFPRHLSAIGLRPGRGGSSGRVSAASPRCWPRGRAWPAPRTPGGPPHPYGNPADRRRRSGSVPRAGTAHRSSWQRGSDGAGGASRGGPGAVPPAEPTAEQRMWACYATERSKGRAATG